MRGMKSLIVASLAVWVMGCSGGQENATKAPPPTATTAPVAHIAPVPAPATGPAAPAAAAVPTPAVAATPTPAFDLGGAGFELVKNWDFGTGPGKTIHNIDEMSEQFQYHDQFNTIANGTNYGAVIVAPNEKTSLKGRHQPIEGVNTGGKPVREFTADSLKTYLVPLDGATTLEPTKHNLGCGSFQAKWTLPHGGSLLGKDLLWETRVKYVTPPYFWFAIWTAGNKWSKGAEIDTVESFGYDNGGGHTNYEGKWWHANGVGGVDKYKYKSWDHDMKLAGVDSFDATQWHVWTLLYRADDTWTIYMDGIDVQDGKCKWTLSAKPDGEPLNMSFIFDGGWGHTGIASVNKPLPASAFEGKFYEWDFSRVYLRPAAAAAAPTTAPSIKK